MTLNQLEYFCAVCRYHSITRAAESLFVSQPTISTSIRNLEKEFHLRLFTHGQNRITLTNDGSLFYKKAEYILHRAHEMYTDFSDKDTNKAPLRIGITSTPSALLLPSLAMEFEEKYGIPVKLMECSSMHARELVDNDELDVAIANLDFYNLDNYDYHTVIEDTYVYCVDKNHHLAKEPSVSFETLKEEPIILFNTDSVQSHTVITGFRSEGATPHIKMYCSQLTTVLNCLSAGNCGAFLYSAMTLPENIVKIPVEPRISTSLACCGRKASSSPTTSENSSSTWEITNSLLRIFALSLQNLALLQPVLRLSRREKRPLKGGCFCFPFISIFPTIKLCWFSSRVSLTPAAVTFCGLYTGRMILLFHQSGSVRLVSFRHSR